MTSVLVVDDSFSESPFFTSVFGLDVDVFETALEAQEAVEDGATWDVAFIDFDLGEGQPSGLSAWIALRDSVHHCISYTRASESGRVLYTLAVQRWFGADAILDKSQARPENLRHYLNELQHGRNPTPPNVQRHLRHAYLIDDLLPTATALRLWRAWNTFQGNEPAVQKALSVTPSVTRKFKEAMESPVDALVSHVLDGTPIEQRGRNAKLMGPIANFAGAQRNFFNAVDLDLALSYRDRAQAQ